MKVIKQILVVSAVLLGSAAAEAQVVAPPTYPDQIYVKENSRARKVIPYTPLREADVMWSKRVWRTLDLREKFNHPLYYPETRINDRRSLFDVMKDALLAKPPRMTAFSNPALDDEFKVPMTPSEIEGLFIQWDSTNQTEDPNNPGTFILAPLKKELNSPDIKQYWMKEDWFLDKQRSVLDVRLLGLCPLKEKVSEGGEVLGYSPLFWIYFPEARPIFANAEVYNPKNDAERRTLEDIFWKRMFQSYVHKESNVYDRFINSYYSGLDILLESDRIKGDIANLEHDLWHF